MSKIVMSMIDEQVQWRKDRNEIVRMCDEKLALAHPAVKEKLKELKETRLALREERYLRSRIFIDLGMISYWELHRLKSGIPSRGLIEKLKLTVEFAEEAYAEDVRGDTSVRPKEPPVES